MDTSRIWLSAKPENNLNLQKIVYTKPQKPERKFNYSVIFDSYDTGTKAHESVGFIFMG
jgi:hypothetical protein